eukprot:g10.t1
MWHKQPSRSRSSRRPVRVVRRFCARNLSLFAPKAWASGGFLADVQVDGYTRLGGQQQWIMRNANISTPSASILGGQWNIVLVGCTGTPPETLPSNGAHVALTNVALTPTVAEKPFISLRGAGDDELGALQRSLPCQERMNLLWVGASSDLTSLIQAKLDLGLHVVLSPGIYNLTAPLTLSTADQVLLGIGMATLVAPKDGRPCVYVKGSATGVRVAGLMLQAAASPSVLKVVPVSTLLQWGEPGAVSGDGGDPTKPGVLSDIFARVGGPDVDRSIGVDVVLRIYSNYDCDYLTYDPPQKKPAFASYFRNINLFTPRAPLLRGFPCCGESFVQSWVKCFSGYEVEHVKISDPDKWFLQMMKPPADSEGKWLYAYSALPVEASIPMKFGVFGEVKWCASGRSWYLIYPGLCLAMGLTPLVGPKGQRHGESTGRDPWDWTGVPTPRIPEWVTRPEIFLKIMDFCTDGTCLLTGALMLTIMEQIPKMVKEEQMGLQPSYITMGYLSLLFGTMTTAFWAAKTWAV